MSRLSSWLVREYRVVAVACAVAAFSFGSAAGQQRGGGFWALVAIAAVLTAIAVGLPMFAERTASMRATDAESAAEHAKQQMRLAVHRVLTPLAYLLGEIADARPRGVDVERLQGQALAVVLAAATELVEPDDARACYFTAEETDPRKLELDGFYGRVEPATLVLVAGSPLGDYALGLVATDEVGYFPDLTRKAPPGWADRPRRHRGLIAVPVATERTAFGLLTVDTLGAGQLTESDVEVVCLLGELLAAALNR